jgi:hypothetical protein
MASPLVKTTPSLPSCQAVRLYVPLHFSFSANIPTSIVAEVWTDLRTTFAGGQGWQAVALEALSAEELGSDLGSAVAVAFPTVAGHFEATFRYRLTGDAADSWRWCSGFGANACIEVLPPLQLAHALLPTPTPESLEELASRCTIAARMLAAKRPIYRVLLDQVGAQDSKDNRVYLASAWHTLPGRACAKIYSLAPPSVVLTPLTLMHQAVVPYGPSDAPTAAGSAVLGAHCGGRMYLVRRSCRVTLLALSLLFNRLACCCRH